jgi:hypothetical protein
LRTFLRFCSTLVRENGEASEMMRRSPDYALIVGIDGTGSNVIVSDNDPDPTNTDDFIAQIPTKVARDYLLAVRSHIIGFMAKGGVRAPDMQDPDGKRGFDYRVETFKRLAAQSKSPDILNTHPILRKIWSLPVADRVRILEFLYYNAESSSAWNVTDYKLSFVRRICNEYAVVSSEWHNGPSNTGEDCRSIGLKAISTIDAWLSNNGFPKNSKRALWDHPKIFLTGYSRGAAIAVWVAEQLQDRRPPVEIDAMFLFDCVDRAWDLDVTGVPASVRMAYHAMRSDEVHSRPTFGHGAKYGVNAAGFESRTFFGTHAAMGGQPWRGDKPAGQTSEADHAASYAVWAYMYGNLLRQGVVGAPSAGNTTGDLGRNYSRALHP